MHKVAIILFPGTNCEAESFRAIKKVGMEPEYFRWNDDKKKLAKYDGYFIAGGFSYEDRVRSGAIAGRDQIMAVIKEQAKGGKPVIGICNGAQILVESGLIPGLKANNLGAALAWNNHGYLNIWTRIKNCAEPSRSAFNNYQDGHHFKLPIAHGEGRFVIPQELLKQLVDNGQAVFRYCDANGVTKDEFPTNPNGAVYNLAGVCNPEGNVLALMPHPERTKDGLVIFKSMKKYLEGGKTKNERRIIKNIQHAASSITQYQKPKDSLEILVELIITDNEAETLQIALKQLGFNHGLKVRRFVHWEIDTDYVTENLVDEIIKSNEILNTSKEIPFINDRSKLNKEAHKILVRDKDDFTGQSKLATLKERLGIVQVNNVKKGVVYEISCGNKDWKKILESNILFNPYSQEGQIIE